MKYKIPGISGSPVNKGNVEPLLNRALENLPVKNMEYDIVRLSGLKMNDCIHCSFCRKKQKPGKYCSMKDDARDIFEKAEKADRMVLASPVYFMRSSARMLVLIDRFRVFVFGNLTAGRMKNKIGMSMAAAWLRNGGLKTTHLNHILALLTLGMIPASSHQGISPLGASILTSTSSPENSKPSYSMGMEDDGQGLLSAQLILKRAVDLVKLTGK
jgi:multimeric flavodoxin WrbA